MKLSARQLQLLREVVARHGVAVDVDYVALAELSEQVREALIDAISTEFITTGLRPDDEPNSRGLELEDLLNVVRGVV